MTVTSVIFDLDGTLVDSASGILLSFAEAFSSLGVKPKGPLSSDVIGPPLWATMCQLADSDDPYEIEPLICAFKAHYDSTGYKETLAYASSKSLLTHLAQFQLPIFLATNKRKTPTDRIIDMLEWRTFFKEIYSLDSVDPAAASKGDLIQHILYTYGLSPMTTLYVGDRIDDAEAAAKAGVNFFHATWGYEQTTEATTFVGGSPEYLLGLLSKSGFSAPNCAPFFAPAI